MKFGTNGIVCAVSLMSAACVTRYDSRALTPNDADFRAAATFTYPREKEPARINLISDEWTKFDARCSVVRTAMVREADGIAMKNAALGSIFAGVTAALAASAGIYASVEGDNANPTVSALLAFGAGGTSVPTFFYFGSDDREKVVRARAAAIDERHGAVQDAWKSFKSVDREFTAANRDSNTANAALKRLEDAGECPAAKNPACAIAQTRADDANRQRVEFIGRWHAATDAVDDAVNELAAKCR